MKNNLIIINNLNISQQWLTVANTDLLMLANPHWLQFDPPSCQQHWIIAIIYTFIVIPGIIGNLGTIIVTFHSKSVRFNRNNCMRVNLAIADLLMNLEIPLLIKNSINCGPIYFSWTACQIYGFTGGLSGTVAIASITFMALDRYLSITRPFDRFDCTREWFTVPFVWMFGIGFASLPFTSDSIRPYVPEGFLTSCSFDYLDQEIGNIIFIVIYGLAAYVLPLLIILFCYIRISQEVHKANQGIIEMYSLNDCSHNASEDWDNKDAAKTTLTGETNESPDGSRGTPTIHQNLESNDHRSSPFSFFYKRPLSALSNQSSQTQKIIQSKLEMEKRLNRSVSLLIVCWLVAWTPYTLVSLFGVLSYKSMISPLCSMLPAMMAKTASVIDPYLYFYSHPSYRQEVQKFFSGIFTFCTRSQGDVSLSLSRITSIVTRKRMSTSAAL